MNREQIERMLRQAGPRERGYAPAPLPPTLEDVRPRRGLLFAARVATFAAAVAGGAVVAVLLTRGGGAPGPGTGPSSTPSPTEHATSSPAGLAACRAGDFAWSTDPWGGAAGGRGTIVLAKLVSSGASCSIDGPARLVLKDANGMELATVVAPATRITLHADEAVEMGVVWSNWCGASPALPVSVSVTLPASPPVPLTPEAGAGIPGCSGGSATSLSATNFQPTTRKPQG